jgi:hypothetical protein
MDEKKDDKRDEKGRFEKGYSGGPGRGRKRKSARSVSLEEIEGYLLPDLKSRDPKVRHPATRLLIALKNKMPDPDNQPFLEPKIEFLLDFTGTFIAYYESTTGKPCSAGEAMKIIWDHLNTCPDSPFRPNEFARQMDNL